MSILATLFLAIAAVVSCARQPHPSWTTVRESQLQDAQTVVVVIARAAHIYEQDYKGQHPASVQELIDQQYLTIDNSSTRTWVFSFESSDAGTQKIIATSTPQMAGGAGWKVVYDPKSAMNPDVFSPKK